MKHQLLHKVWQLSLTGLIVAVLGVMTGFAQTTPDEGDDETPAFTNPAQAQKAENISAATATEPSEEDIALFEDAEEKAEALEEAEADLAAAQEALDQLPDDATQEEIDLATQALEEAQNAYDQAQTAYDEAAALAEDALAELAGVSVDDINEMRQTMGWGQICNTLGIDPSVVGLGLKHQKGYRHRHLVGYPDDDGEPVELQAMTRRNLRTGWSTGHGPASGIPAGDHTPEQKRLKTHTAVQTNHAASAGNTGKGSDGNGGNGNGNGGDNAGGNNGNGGSQGGGNSGGNQGGDSGGNGGGNSGGNGGGNSGGNGGGGKN